MRWRAPALLYKFKNTCSEGSYSQRRRPHIVAAVKKPINRYSALRAHLARRSECRRSTEGSVSIDWVDQFFLPDSPNNRQDSEEASKSRAQFPHCAWKLFNVAKPFFLMPLTKVSRQKMDRQTHEASSDKRGGAFT